MNSLFEKRQVDTTLLLRALAISFVALNHANPSAHRLVGFSFHGGMNVLMALSGYFFAKLVLTAPSAPEMRRRLLKFAKSLFIPCFLMVIFFFIILWKFDLLELLFVKNFETYYRVSKFPTWYPQVILQIMIVIYALSFIPGLGSWGKLYLPYSVVALFLIFVAINRYLPHYLPGASEQLPHLQFWNFCLGWCFYFFSDPLSSPLRNRVAMLVILIAVVLLKFDFSTSVPFVLIGGAAILLFVKNVSLPAILSKAVTIIAAASFVIFLWHRFFFEVYKRLAHLPSHQGGLGMWLFGMIGSLLIWSLWESFERTWQKFARVPAADPGRPRNPLGAMMHPFWARHSTQID